MELNGIPKFDVVDLDPYGSIAPFLDAAIHSCNNLEGKSTLICITCTDSRVLCGPDA
jgi:tRNA (guanine26-N2/guanine27-N2)-dimethyltransferase